MICISFIGMFVSLIIMAVAMNIVMFNTKIATHTKRNISWASNITAGALLIWWLAGFLVSCETTIGPIISSASRRAPPLAPPMTYSPQL